MTGAAALPPQRGLPPRTGDASPPPGQPALLVVDDDGALGGAEYSFTRRGGELHVAFGFPGAGERLEHGERVRPGVENVLLVLVARGGRGVFPTLEQW